jgi:YVTN family beta-propeller protein
MRRPTMTMTMTVLVASALIRLTPALADAALGKAADNAIYAQRLVNETLASHPELVVIGMHAVKPGAKDSTMIAANLDRIGKADDEDDLAVSRERKTILAPNLKDPTKFEVAVPLRDASGKVIGSLSTVFKYGAGDDEVKMHATAVAIRDDLAKKTPNLAALFKASPVAVTSAPGGDQAAILQSANTIEVPASSGKFDFLRIDSKRHRLLAAHENDGTADYFDLQKSTLIKRLKLGGAVDMAVDPDSAYYYVSVQEDARVAVVDAATLQEVKSIKTEGPTDAILYEPKNHRIYVTNDEGSHVWVIDPVTAKVVDSIAIPGVPEFLVYDAAADRIYLNLKTADKVAVIDPAAGKVVALWPTAPATQPHGMALDSEHHRIFTAGGNGKLAVLDTATGKLMTSVDIVAKVDQIAFDAAAHLVYCAGPDQMTVVRTSGPSVVTIGAVSTAATAKNVAVDQQTGAVWTTYTDGKSSFAKSWVPRKGLLASGTTPPDQK